MRSRLSSRSTWSRPKLERADRDGSDGARGARPVRGRAGHRRRRSHARAEADPRADRPERRRQDDLRQRAHRLPAADGGHVTRRPRHHRVGGEPARAHRPRTDVPERPALPVAVRARERRGCGGRPRLAARAAGSRSSCSSASACATAPTSGGGRFPTAGARLGIAPRARARPRYLLLDEPAAGLNEAESDELVGRSQRSATTSAAGCWSSSTTCA